MRDLLGGTKRKASFVGTHFMAICLGLLVLALALTMLTNCGGSGDGTAASTTRSYERTPATTESGRIIRGQDRTMYYTSDHYVSFRRIQR